MREQAAQISKTKIISRLYQIKRFDSCAQGGDGREFAFHNNQVSNFRKRSKFVRVALKRVCEEEYRQQCSDMKTTSLIFGIKISCSLSKLDRKLELIQVQFH